MLHDAGPVTHANRVGRLTGPLAVTSLMATSAYLVILAVLHVLPTGYSPVRHAVSDYGVGRYRPLFTVALYVSSVGVLTLAFALISGVGSPPLAIRDLVYLLLISIARVGMTLFPTNLESERISRTGLLHYACAVAAFTLTYPAISGMTPALRALDPSEWARPPLGWMAGIVGPALALVVITDAPTAAPGVSDAHLGSREPVGRGATPRKCVPALARHAFPLNGARHEGCSRHRFRSTPCR